MYYISIYVRVCNIYVCIHMCVKHTSTYDPEVLAFSETKASSSNGSDASSALLPKEAACNKDCFSRMDI